VCTRYLPRTKQRQTMLFSATMPSRVIGKLEKVLPEEYETIMLLNDHRDSCSAVSHDSRKGNNQTTIGAVPTSTSDSMSAVQISQSYMTLQRMEDYTPTLITLLHQHKQQKVMVFFPAARIVKYFGQVLPMITEIPLWHIHSRMSSGARQRANTGFRDAKRGALLTSDVSARGTCLRV
jgi:ATP-dependent RNA helicase MSS116, mitochondrial